MAQIVTFEGANFQFGPPPGLEEMVGVLPCFTNGRSVVTCWELTPEELAEVARTGRIFQTQICNNHVFPMYIGGESEVKEVCSDTGKVW